MRLKISDLASFLKLEIKNIVKLVQLNFLFLFLSVGVNDFGNKIMLINLHFVILHNF